MQTIVHRSAAIVTFLSLVGVSLNAPPLRHLERFADLLGGAPRRTTLAHLAAQELDGVDASHLAAFFRISPWDPDDLRLPILAFILGYLRPRTEPLALPIYFTLDDSLTPQDKGTHKLQGIDWHFDHNQKRTIKGGCHVVLGLHGGDFHFPLTGRLDLRESTVRRLNNDQRRRNKPRPHYRSELGLARQLLQQVIPFLPPAHPVSVPFDSWYTAAKSVKWLRQPGWHASGAIKSNRNVSGQELTAWRRACKGRSYDRVSLGLANKQRRTDGTRTRTGRIRGAPGEVRVVISQRGPGVRTPE